MDGYIRESFTHDGRTRDVYFGGAGPGVVVITEIPGIHPYVLEFASHVIDAGFSVALPDVYGEAGKPRSTPYILSSITKGCVSRDFTVLARGRESPIMEWLRALCREVHTRCGGPGVGAVGMCFTGGFALAMMVEPALIAPVLSQPSLPFAVSPAHARDVGISDEQLATVKQRCETEDLCVMGLRFEGDPMAPESRFRRLEEELGDRFVGIRIPDAARNPRGKPAPAHSVLTTDLIDEPGQPTHEARERVIQLFRDKLMAPA